MLNLLPRLKATKEKAALLKALTGNYAKRKITNPASNMDASLAEFPNHFIQRKKAKKELAKDIRLKERNDQTNLENSRASILIVSPPEAKLAEVEQQIAQVRI